MTTQTLRQAEFTAALINPALPVPAGVVTHRGVSDPKRFAVYRNNVHVGLVGVLVAKYPVCVQLVGQDFFTAMARIYVADHKPASPIMMLYGHDFAGFIEDFAAARAVPYLSDMALVEEAWSVAYNAADDRAAGIEGFAAAGPQALTEMRLAPHAAATLVVSRYPIGSIWSAHQSGGLTVPPEGQSVLITRPMLEVKVTVIPQADAVFASQLFAGEPIGIAAARTSELFPDFDFGRALVGLCSLGAFRQAATGDLE